MISLRLSPRPSFFSSRSPTSLSSPPFHFSLPFTPAPSAARIPPAPPSPPAVPPLPDSYLFDFFFHDYPTTYRRRASASFFYRDALLDHRLDHVLTYTYVLTTDARARARARSLALARKGEKERPGDKEGRKGSWTWEEKESRGVHHDSARRRERWMGS